MDARYRPIAKPRSLMLGVLAALAIGLTPMATVHAQDSGTSEVPVSVQAAMSFRHDFGLREDEDYVTASFDDPDFSDGDWGIPLNRAELDDLAGRVNDNQSILGVIEWAHDRSDTGGVYLDQKRGGMPVFLFVDRMKHFRDEFAERMPASIDFEVELVDHSLAELTAVKDDITRDWFDLRKQGIYLVYSQVDVVNNRVEVGVLERTDKAVSVLEAYAGFVRVVQQDGLQLDACAGGITNCRPIKGGIKVNNPTWYCTAGYMVRLTDDGHNDVGLVTAGHCIYQNDHWGFVPHLVAQRRQLRNRVGGGRRRLRRASLISIRTHRAISGSSTSTQTRCPRLDATDSCQSPLTAPWHTSRRGWLGGARLLARRCVASDTEAGSGTRTTRTTRRACATTSPCTTATRLLRVIRPTPRAVSTIQRTRTTCVV